jgi:hypothetical protein
MGMNTRIVGIKPPDDKWKKMEEVWSACEHASIPTPKLVEEFFGDSAPDPAGVIVELEGTPAVTKYAVDMEDGFEVHIDKLPKDVKVIRFYNSY